MARILSDAVQAEFHSDPEKHKFDVAFRYGGKTSSKVMGIDDAAFMQQLNLDLAYRPVPSGFLPHFIRYMSPDRRVIAFEQPPKHVNCAMIAKKKEAIESVED